MKYNPLDFTRFADVAMKNDELAVLIGQRVLAGKLLNLRASGLDYYSVGKVYGLGKEEAKAMVRRLSLSLRMPLSNLVAVEWDDAAVDAALSILSQPDVMPLLEWQKKFAGAA